MGNAMLRNLLIFWIILIPKTSDSQNILDKVKIKDVQEEHHIRVEKMFSLDSSSFYYCDDIYNRIGFDIRTNGDIVKMGTWTKQIDTVTCDNSLAIFINPFPHVYLHKSYSDEDRAGPKPYSTDGYTMIVENGYVIEACILNDTNGTLKHYWHKGVMYQSGYFWYNQKNGRWKYWDEKGVFVKEEWYDKGVLLK